jgi:hypothetical protein
MLLQLVALLLRSCFVVHGLYSTIVENYSIAASFVSFLSFYFVAVRAHELVVWRGTATFGGLSSDA